MKLDLITNNAIVTETINPNDEFYTPKYAIEPIIKYINKDKTVWCPFDTEQSNFVIMLKEKGMRVICSHIENGVDFFNCIVPDCDIIISNPPYSKKFEVFKRLYEIGKPFAMLVGVVGLFESQKRFNLFKENNFEIMYFNKRIAYFKNYEEPKPSLNPPFSSVFVCNNILPDRIIFETILVEHRNKSIQPSLFEI